MTRVGTLFGRLWRWLWSAPERSLTPQLDARLRRWMQRHPGVDRIALYSIFVFAALAVAYGIVLVVFVDGMWLLGLWAIVLGVWGWRAGLIFRRGKRRSERS